MISSTAQAAPIPPPSAAAFTPAGLTAGSSTGGKKAK